MTFKIIISLIVCITLTTKAMENPERPDPNIRRLIEDIDQWYQNANKIKRQAFARHGTNTSNAYWEALTNHSIFCNQVLSIILYVDKPIAVEKLMYAEDSYLKAQLSIAEIFCKRGQQQRAKNILRETINTIYSWMKKNYARLRLENDVRDHYEKLETDISSNPFGHRGRRVKNPRLSPVMEIERNTQAPVPLMLQAAAPEHIPAPQINKHSIDFLLN